MAMSTFSGSGLGVPASTANFTDTPTGTYTDGGVNYKYLTLTSTGTVTIDRAGTCDMLIIGGGGSGGASASGAGGGGAGGHLELTGVHLPAGTLTCVVGDGGAAMTQGGGNNTMGGKTGLPSSVNGQYYSPGGGSGNTNLFTYNFASSGIPRAEIMGLLVVVVRTQQAVLPRLIWLVDLVSPV